MRKRSDSRPNGGQLEEPSWPGLRDGAIVCAEWYLNVKNGGDRSGSYRVPTMGKPTRMPDSKRISILHQRIARITAVFWLMRNM